MQSYGDDGKIRIIIKLAMIMIITMIARKRKMMMIIRWMLPNVIMSKGYKSNLEE